MFRRTSLKAIAGAAVGTIGLAGAASAEPTASESPVLVSFERDVVTTSEVENEAYEVEYDTENGTATVTGQVGYGYEYVNQDVTFNGFDGDVAVFEFEVEEGTVQPITTKTVYEAVFEFPRGDVDSIFVQQTGDTQVESSDS